MRFGVVADESAGGAEVEDGARRGRNVAEEVDVRHDVVAEAALVTGSRVKVDVVQVVAHLSGRLGGDVESQFALCLGQGQPEAPPCSEAEGGGEDALHLARYVPRRQGVARPELCEERASGAEDVQRQEAVVPVIAVEVPPLLAAVHRIVRRVDVQHQSSAFPCPAAASRSTSSSAPCSATPTPEPPTAAGCSASSPGARPWAFSVSSRTDHESPTDLAIRKLSEAELPRTAERRARRTDAATQGRCAHRAMCPRHPLLP